MHSRMQILSFSKREFIITKLRQFIGQTPCLTALIIYSNETEILAIETGKWFFDLLTLKSQVSSFSVSMSIQFPFL